jgi:hypothetical protein
MKGGKGTIEKKRGLLPIYSSPSPGRIQNRELLRKKAGGGLEKERAKF